MIEQKQGSFSQWFQYLLKEELPIEIKRIIVNGQIPEF